MMDLLMSHPAIAPYVVWLISMISVASAIDCSLPQPSPGSHWIIVRRLISYAALNFGNAADLRSPAVRTWLLRALMIALRMSPTGTSLRLLGLVAEKLLGWPGLGTVPVDVATPPKVTMPPKP